jgi:hypothetical protein
VDNLPVAFGDALRVKRSTCDYLPCDRQRGHTDTVRFQVSAEHGRGRPERRLAEGNGRQGRDRVVGEPASGDQDGRAITPVTVQIRVLGTWVQIELRQRMPVQLAASVK